MSMPHVVVYYQPQVYDEEQIAFLKRSLPAIVSQALSDKGNLIDYPQEERDIIITEEMVMVTDYAAKPSDMNVPSLEIHIHTGERQERSSDKVMKAIAREFYMDHIGWINSRGSIGKVVIAIMFHSENSYEKVKDLTSFD
jgi:hypothetical protein